MTLTFDEAANRFGLDANDIDTSSGVINIARPFIASFQAKPGCALLIYRDEPTSEAMDFSQITSIPSHHSDALIETLRGRKIAGVLGSADRFAVGRQIAAFAESVGINYHPFKTEQDAIAWLEK